MSNIFSRSKSGMCVYFILKARTETMAFLVSIQETSLPPKATDRDPTRNKKAIERGPFLGRSIAVRQSGARGQMQPNMTSDARQHNERNRFGLDAAEAGQHHPKAMSLQTNTLPAGLHAALDQTNQRKKIDAATVCGTSFKFCGNGHWTCRHSLRHPCGMSAARIVRSSFFGSFTAAVILAAIVVQPCGKYRSATANVR
jgi:hypothetical protein